MHDRQLRVVPLRDGDCTLECAITSSTQVSREQDFARSSWVGRSRSQIVLYSGTGIACRCSSFYVSFTESVRFPRASATAVNRNIRALEAQPPVWLNVKTRAVCSRCDSSWIAGRRPSGVQACNQQQRRATSPCNGIGEQSGHAHCHRVDMICPPSLGDSCRRIRRRRQRSVNLPRHRHAYQL